jgi:hypothetical protein
MDGGETGTGKAPLMLDCAFSAARSPATGGGKGVGRPSARVRPGALGGCPATLPLGAINVTATAIDSTEKSPRALDIWASVVGQDSNPVVPGL